MSSDRNVLIHNKFCSDILVAIYSASHVLNEMVYGFLDAQFDGAP